MKFILLLGFTSAVFAMDMPAQVPPGGQTAAPALKSVYVGGTVDFEKLAVAGNVSALLATGCAGLYLHSDAVYAAMQDGAIHRIVDRFAGTGPGMAEVGYGTPALITKVMQERYNANGEYPVVAAVNDYTSTYAQYTAFVDAARASSPGLRYVGIVESPNDDASPLDWDDPFYDVYKQKARYGGALVLDTPVKQEAVRGSGYTRVAQQQLKWCHDNGVVCVLILSPSAPEDKTFLDDTRNWVAAVTARGDHPAAWVVENYVAGVAPGMGNDKTPDSVLGVALYLAQNFPSGQTPAVR